MSASPAAAAVATPVGDIVSTVAFDEVHVPAAVTFWIEPSNSVAVAVSCAAWPTSRREAPLTATDVTDGDVGAAGAWLPHPAAKAGIRAIGRTISRARKVMRNRADIVLPKKGRCPRE